MKKNRRGAGAVVSIAASCAVFVLACGSDAGSNGSINDGSGLPETGPDGDGSLAPQPGGAAAADRPEADDGARENPWIGAISASERPVVPTANPAAGSAAPEAMAPEEEAVEDVAPASPEAPLPEEEAPEVTVSATSNDDEAALAHDDDASTWWSPAQDRDVITLSLGAVRSVSEIVMTTNTGFTLAGDSAAFADSPLEITSDGESWVAVPLINFNNLANSCDVSRLSVGSIACGFDPPRSLSQVRFEIRQEQLNGVPSVQELRIYELDAVLIDSPR